MSDGQGGSQIIQVSGGAEMESSDVEQLEDYEQQDTQDAVYQPLQDDQDTQVQPRIM